MAINKVVYGNRTLIDITDSTVTPQTLAKGVVAYNSSGEKIEGTMQGLGEIKTQGNYKYRVNDDGTFEVWFKQTEYTISINYQSGTLYRSPLTSLALPSDLYNNYNCNIVFASVDCAHNNFPTFGMLASIYETGANFYAMSGGNRGTSSSYILSAYFFGTLTAK